MSMYICDNKCCTTKVLNNYIPPKFKINKSNRKSGVFIYDPNKKKVLLIQSNGNLWGPPKGSMELNETPVNCAIREVKEETGLQVSSNQFKRVICINGNAIYFYMEYQEFNPSLQTNLIHNDATGITWIKPKCLSNYIKKGNINITSHCRILFYSFMKIKLPYSNFTIVK